MDATLSLWCNSSSNPQESKINPYGISPIDTFLPLLVALLLFPFGLLFVVFPPPLVPYKTKNQHGDQEKMTHTYQQQADTHKYSINSDGIPPLYTYHLYPPIISSSS